jgi:hypothetical protein
LVVYLPAAYEGSSKHYPIIYFLPIPFESSYRFVFDQRDAQGLFDRAIAAGVIEKFILVWEIIIGSLVEQGQKRLVQTKKADPTQISPLATRCNVARILPANSGPVLPAREYCSV